MELLIPRGVDGLKQNWRRQQMIKTLVLKLQLLPVYHRAQHLVFHFSHSFVTPLKISRKPFYVLVTFIKSFKVCEIFRFVQGYICPKKFLKFPVRQLRWSLFFGKLQINSLQLYLKLLRHRYFPENFPKFFRVNIFQNASGRLLLKWIKSTSKFSCVNINFE